MADRLWLRLAAGMALVVLVAVGAVAVLAHRVTGERFRDYVADVSDTRSRRIESVLSRHFARYGDWSRAEATVQLVADLTGQRVVVADTRGRIAADSQGKLVGQYAQPSWQGEPVIISFQEHPVGSVYLDPLRSASSVDQRGQSFLAANNAYLVWAAAAGLIFALVTSLLLARRLARPLEQLTLAVRQMESGRRVEPIDVRIGGEVGALARAFNSAAESLSRMERLRKQMVADIAHELRTPLTNVRGYFEAIQDGVMEPSGETLAIVEYELGQLTRLLDDLQELAQAESGQLKLQREETELGELVAWEVRTLRPQAERDGVDLQLDLAHVLPPLQVDRGRLGQVLRNILRNALTHTPSGGQVVVRLDEAGGDAVITVRDTGSGIAPDDLPHIFERFYRGDKSRSRQAGGSGLGLTIARELVVAHGGTIGAESQLGSGTCFTICLPVAPPAPAEAAAASGGPVAPLAGTLALARAGAALGAMFGALAGALEAVLVTMNWTSQSLAQVVGYAVLIDAAAFGLLGAVLLGVGGAVARLVGRPLSVARATALWTPACCLLVGLLVYSRWKQLADSQDALVAPQLMFAMVAILGVAAWIALLAGALLEPRRGDGRRALLLSGRVAPVAVALALGLGSVGVARDLAGRGSVASAEPSASGGVAAVPAPPTSALPTPAVPTAVLPLTPPSAAGALPSPALASPPGTLVQRAPNVLLITVEALRNDHLGQAGYVKARTRSLDRLAAEGVRFANALAQAPAGSGGHASLLTGTYLSTHGVRLPLVDQLSPGAPTLAEVLASRGYATSAVYSWLSYEPAYSGLERGFQLYTDVTINRPAYLADSRTSALAATFKRLKTFLALPGAMDRSLALSDEVTEQLDGKADVTTAAVLEWLGARRTSPQPFFLWAHYFDPHYPYTPPSPFDQADGEPCPDCPDGSMATIRRLRSDPPPDLTPQQIDRLIELYDGEIAFTDREIGRLLQALNTWGLAQNTIVIVVGSHGQSFGEHGHWLDGDSLYDTEVHVPLIMSFPGRLPVGRTVDAVAQQVDVAPTVLELLGIRPPDQVEGRSLLPVVRGQAAGGERVGVSELPDGSAVAVASGSWKLIKRAQDGRVELYRVTDDPDELQDIAEQEPDVVAELERMLEQWAGRRR